MGEGVSHGLSNHKRQFINRLESFCSDAERLSCSVWVECSNRRWRLDSGQTPIRAAPMTPAESPISCRTMGVSRLFTSLILGSGALAETWRVGSVSFTRYHSLFVFHGSSVLVVSVLLILVPALVRDVKPMPSV